MKKLNLYKNLLWLPAVFIYLELVIHIFMGMNLKYFPVYLPFSVAYGALLTAVCAAFGKKTFPVLIKIFTIATCLLYGAEFFAKAILQTFYPFSILSTAAGNHLEEFTGVIIETIAAKFYVLILVIVPAVLSFFLLNDKQRTKAANRSQRKKRLKNSAIVIISLILAIVCFLIGLLIVYVIPSKSDITPKMLYESDTGFDDQVEQLGLINMLRLDVKHMIWPVESNEEFTAPEIEDEPEPEAVYNVMDFDFDAMTADAPNNNIKWLSQYFSSLSGTKQNNYTGMLKGYNVVFLTLEGMSGYAISQEYTPTLYKLTHEGMIFNNFYTALHYTSTSNGECQNLLGLYPKNGNPITMSRTGELKTNCYFSLAQQLGRLGYTNLAFHNNQYDLYNRANSHSNLGYDYYCAHIKKGYFLVDGKTWPQKDSYMIDQSVGMYASGEQPFNVYYITISGHTPYGWNYPSAQYKEALADAPYSEKTKGYLGTCMEVDKALEHLINALDEAGTLDKTLIVAVPDHIPYGSVEILEELSGKEFGTSEALSAINESAIDFDVYKSCLIMWNSRMAEERPIVVNKPCCQVDILPTISNLLGLEYDSRMLAGSDLLSDENGLVVFSSKSWKSDKGFYNRFTQKFTPAEGIEMTEDEINTYVENMKSIVANKLDCTSKIIESNFYDYAVKYLNQDDQNVEQTAAQN